ncbi:MAG: ATP-binding protein [Pseudomonadota bacterium]
MRRSVFARMVLTVSLVFALGIGVTLGLVYLLMNRQIETLLAEQIAADIAQFNRIKGAQELMRVLTLRLQSERSAGGGTVLLLQTKAGENPMRRANLAGVPENFGNIDAWPAGLPESVARPRLIWAANRRMLVRTMTHGADLRLLVGRDFSAWSSFRDRLAATLLALLGLAIVFAALGGLLVSRRLLFRLNSINRFCAGIEESGLGERLPVAAQHDEFDALCGAINGMLDRIAELARLNRIATDQIAHDMRTPLTPVMVSLDRLSQPDAAPPDRDTLAGLAEDLRRLRGMFGSMLELSRIEAGGRRAETALDLAELARDTAEMYRPWAETCGIEIVEQLEPAPMRGAPMLLRQAIGNLLSNALRYQEEAGQILLRTGSDRGSFAEVLDHGPGIPTEDLPRVTQRLFRRAEHRHMDGHGMGLAFVDAIAKAHGMVLTLSPHHPGADRPGLKARLHAPSQRPV